MLIKIQGDMSQRRCTDISNCNNINRLNGILGRFRTADRYIPQMGKYKNNISCSYINSMASENVDYLESDTNDIDEDRTCYEEERERIRKQREAERLRAERVMTQRVSLRY